MVAHFYLLHVSDASPMTEADLSPCDLAGNHRTGPLATSWPLWRGGSRHAVTGGGELCKLSDMRDEAA